LYKYNLNETFKLNDIKTQRIEWLKKELHKIFIDKKKNNETLLLFTEKLYEKGYCGLDIIQLLENHAQFLNLSNEKRYELLFAFNKVKKEFRNEKILIIFILNFLLMSLDFSLENITFM